MLTATGLTEDGVVEIDGERPGAVYLVDGGVSYAETPHAPGIGERLIAAGRLTADEWTSLRAIGGSGPRFAELLAGYGIERHELTSLTESVVVDSILALLTAAGSARFVPGRRHWMDVGIRLDGAAVRDVLALRAPGTVAATIDADSVVCLAGPDRRWHILTAEQWRVLCRLPDRARIRDLALAEAIGVYEVVDRVAALVEAGLCTVVPAGPHPTAPAAWEESATVPELVPWSGPVDAGPGGAESAPQGPAGTVAGQRDDWPAGVAERGLVDHGPAGPTAAAEPDAGWWRDGMYDHGVEPVRTADATRSDGHHRYDTGARGSSAWAARPWAGWPGERPGEDDGRWSGGRYGAGGGEARPADEPPTTAVDAGVDAPVAAGPVDTPRPAGFQGHVEPAGRDEPTPEPLPRRRPGQALSPATVFRLRDAARRDDESDRGPDTQTLRLLLGSLQRLEEG